MNCGGSSFTPFDLHEAIGYIRQSYDHTVGLFQEAPNSAPTTYWFHNDLYVAQLALGGMPTGALDLQWPNLAPPRIRVLGGMTFTDNTVTAQNKTVVISQGQRIIKTETPDRGASPQSVSMYADIAFFSAIHLFNQGAFSKARQAVHAAEEAFWDGHGWNDESFKHSQGDYESYKNALYLIACRMLGLAGAHTQANMVQLQKCQVLNRAGFANQQGGVSTHYTPTNPWAGDTNIETTADAVIAVGLDY